MNPLITVLMPVHNGAAYLAEAMESILRQSLADFEFLVVDDASTDHSAALVRNVKDPRVRLIPSTERLKLSGALNLGLDQARGRYVARMDADDISLPRRLESQARFLEQNPAIGLCGTWIRYFGGSTRTILERPVPHDEIHAFMLLDTPFAHPTVMLRRDAIEQHHLRFNGDFFPTEDFELWTRAIRQFPVANLPEVLLHYRIHSQSLTGSDWSTMDEQAARIIRAQLEPLGLEPTLDELRFHRKLAMGHVTMTRETLNQAEAWIATLMAANRRTHTFKPDALHSVLGEVWFRTCMHASRLGFWVAKHYADSPLTTHDRNRRRREWMMKAAALKGKIT